MPIEISFCHRAQKVGNLCSGPNTAVAQNDPYKFHMKNNCVCQSTGPMRAIVPSAPRCWFRGHPGINILWYSIQNRGMSLMPPLRVAYWRKATPARCLH